MVELLAGQLEGFVSAFGPVAVFLAMLLETVFPPIPSEVVLPLAGYLAFTSGMGLAGLALMTVVATLGTTVGAVVIYYISLYGGRKAVLKYGRRVWLDEKKLKTVERWFEKHGDHAVFLCRMAPGLRELVSIPAGLARMNFVRFVVITFLGSLIWSAFLASIGFFFGEAYASLSLERMLNVAMLVIALGAVAYLIVRHVRGAIGRRS